MSEGELMQSCAMAVADLQQNITSLCGRDGRTICGPQSLSACRKVHPWR